MPFNTTAYTDYETNLPQTGCALVGHPTSGGLLVYQAYNSAIADYALAHQKFGGPHYSLRRMTWIKPNFLWMMFRSGWATKPNQERILAIDLEWEVFLSLLSVGVMSNYDARLHDSQAEWGAALRESEVRIQWDPDHDPWGKKLARRALQVGIKGLSLERFNTEGIRNIFDLTPFVVAQRLELQKPGGGNLNVVAETRLVLPQPFPQLYL
ncbi:MAG: DUF4291 domain-containing protein [Lewinella sp.]|nr:DUF4291 domain-containing protein [Lewinella sp.]